MKDGIGRDIFIGAGDCIRCICGPWGSRTLAAGAGADIDGRGLLRGAGAEKDPGTGRPAPTCVRTPLPGAVRFPCGTPTPRVIIPGAPGALSPIEGALRGSSRPEGMLGVLGE